jgi:hypothetical protein
VAELGKNCEGRRQTSKPRGKGNGKTNIRATKRSNREEGSNGDDEPFGGELERQKKPKIHRWKVGIVP